jgi:signal transduction histidine kinase
VEAIQRIDAVPSILEVACRVTGLRFAAIARVTEERWTACAVRDEIDFGLTPGGELEIATTLCDEIRKSGDGVVIDHVAEDPTYRTHHTPATYGFQSYISMPIVRADGAFFGTLCALDPRPAKLSDPSIVATFKLFAELIAMHLDSQDRLTHSRAALADAARTAELREQFIAVLGHDLRNPVASIEAGTRMLAGMELDPKAAHVVALMQDSCRRMGGLINDMLDFARGSLGGGLAVSRRAEGDLGEMLDLVIAELRTAHPGRTIEAEISLEESVHCDPARIGQLLSNLIANALVHGDPEAAVRVTSRSEQGRFRLEVANRGAPIPADKLGRLFQPFERAERGQPHKGLGLGLYIAAEIAKAHGGAIQVASDEAETRFTLAMPNKAVEALPVLA